MNSYKTTKYDYLTLCEYTSFYNNIYPLEGGVSFIDRIRNSICTKLKLPCGRKQIDVKDDTRTATTAGKDDTRTATVAKKDDTGAATATAARKDDASSIVTHKTGSVRDTSSFVIHGTDSHNPFAVTKTSPERIYPSYIKQEDPHDYYTFNNILGEGSYGKVYNGVKNSTGEKVAIKILNRIDEFVEEVAILHNLQDICQEYILCYVDSYISENKGYIVTELLIKYVTLGKWIPENAAKCDCDMIEKIINGLLAGLEKIHNNGYTHRDIKPDNIMLKIEDNKVSIKFIDFGLACKETSEGCKYVYGTIGYISPHYGRQNEDKTIREYRDKWALGSTIMDIFLKFNILSIMLYNHKKNFSCNVENTLLNIYIGEKIVLSHNFGGDYGECKSCNASQSCDVSKILKDIYAEVHTMFEGHHDDLSRALEESAKKVVEGNRMEVGSKKRSYTTIILQDCVEHIIPYIFAIMGFLRSSSIGECAEYLYYDDDIYLNIFLKLADKLDVPTLQDYLEKENMRFKLAGTELQRLKGLVKNKVSPLFKKPSQ